MYKQIGLLSSILILRHIYKKFTINNFYINSIINIEIIKTFSNSTLGNKDYQIYFTHNNKIISCWHDIPLVNENNTFNFICEIPKWTRNKMEINKEIDYNPIKQDIIVNNNKLRQYNYGDIMFNYGAFPMTWEDPKHISKYTNCKGDNDPLDVIEIGSVQLKMASITKVKVIGILGMIDDNETDWKIIAINKNDCLADKINTINDINIELPGLLDAIRTWLTNYKLIDGKSENKFAFEGEYKDAQFAYEIIKECHESWKNEFDK